MMKVFFHSLWIGLLLGLVVSAPGDPAEKQDREFHVSIAADGFGGVQVRQDDGGAVVTLTGIQFKWKPAGATRKDPAFAVKTKGGVARETTAPDGLRAVEVNYVVDAAGNGTAPVQIKGHYTLRDARVDGEFDLTGLPQGAQIEGLTFGRKLPKGIREIPPSNLNKPGLWQRHPYGGLPVEIADGKLQQCVVGEQPFFIAFDVSAIGDNGTGGRVAKFSVLFPPKEWPTEAVSAWRHGRSLALRLATGKVFNWWTDPKAPLSLDASVVNVAGEPRTIRLSYWVRNFAGEFVVRETSALRLAPGEVHLEKIRFNASTPRDLFFAEVSAVDEKSGAEVFGRTNLALLPPHEFQSTSEDSLCGIAAYWPLPDEASVQGLLERMGVRWLRHGKAQDYQRITPLCHTSTPKMENEAEQEAWIKQKLEACAADGNQWWEFGNELNYACASIGMGDLVKDTERTRIIEQYIGWLKTIRRLQKEMGLTQIKIISLGIAGMDVKFVEKFVELGGWDLVDGFALHPGRGNFTPDYTGPASYGDWVIGKYGSYWNYYGSVRLARKLLDQYGGNKPLWLTEVYAPGFPNSFWEDSPRHGAENVILSLALAKTEGVKAVMWYQLFDGVWHDPLGVNSQDREYSFGIVQRDLSFKPSLMAYCTAAEALDKATFRRWLQFKNGTLKGLLFDTPRGPMAVVWSRADGYILSEDREHFASPEPWVDEWKTHTAVKVPVTGSALTAVNAIGQAREIPAENKSATLDVTGAPVIIYGLDAEQWEKQ